MLSPSTPNELPEASIRAAADKRILDLERSIKLLQEQLARTNLHRENDTATRKRKRQCDDPREVGRKTFHTGKDANHEFDVDAIIKHAQADAKASAEKDVTIQRLQDELRSAQTKDESDKAADAYRKEVEELKKEMEQLKLATKQRDESDRNYQNRIKLLETCLKFVVLDSIDE
jgi:hypothetical protein